MTKIQHKRSSVLVSGAAKAPTSAQLDYGELAINYSSTDPQFFIKDSSGSVISILSSYAPLAGADFTGNVSFDADVVIKGDSTNGSGALTLNCESNDHAVKIKGPAHSASANYTLTLPTSAGSSGEVLSTDGSGGLSWAYAAMSTADKTKLDGIATGAEVNVNADWNASSGDAQILNKPTNVSTFTNDAGYITGSYSNFLTSNADDTATGSYDFSPSSVDRAAAFIKNISSPSNYYNGLQVEVRATNGIAGISLHRAGYSHVGIYHDAYDSLKFNMNTATVTLNSNTGVVWGNGNDGSGSGLDADRLDGIDSASFLRSDTADTATGTITFQGTTTAPWKLWCTSAAGSWSTLEFVASTEWGDSSSYSVLGGQSTGGVMIRKPHIVWNANHASADIRLGRSGGVSSGGWVNMGVKASNVGFLGYQDTNVLTWNSSGNVTIVTDTRSPIYYDSNNTGYYLDPASTSNTNVLVSMECYTNGWFRNYQSNEGMYNQATGAHWYSDGDGIWNLTGNTQDQSTSLKFRGTHNGNIEGWIHANGGGWFGTLNAAGQWALKSYIVDGYSPNLYFDEESNETWTGNPGSDEGKIEYHSNRFYIASGSNSTEIVRFRRSGSDVAYINNSGYFYSPIMYDQNNTGYYIDPASHSNLNTARFQGNALYIRGSSPTLYFQDTNNRSCMIHNNSNLCYILRGSGNDSTSWTTTGGHWPFIVNLENNDITCGRNISAIGNVTAYSSDRRLKQNFNPIQGALDKVKSLTGLYFDWKPEVNELGFIPDQMTNDIGLIAQDVQAVLPQAVKPAPFDQVWDNDKLANVSVSGEDYITVQYERLVPLLVEAIKELSVRLTVLENKL